MTVVVPSESRKRRERTAEADERGHKRNADPHLGVAALLTMMTMINVW
jgi:hypothetical protein